MTDHTVISLKQPDENAADTVTELSRSVAKELIEPAVEAELEEFLTHDAD